MDQFWEILKYTLPSLILFFTIYFVLKVYFKRQQESEIMKLTADAKKDVLPLRIQAYERLMLFCERINIQNLVYRLRKSDMSVKQLQSALMIAVQQELEHNISQQIYISGNLWKIVELAKNEVLNQIASASEQFNPDDNALAYSNALISGDNSYLVILDKAKEALRSEVKLLF